MKKRFLKAALAMLLCVPSAVEAKVEHLLPKPQQISVVQGSSFALSGDVTINYSSQDAKCELLEEFFANSGCALVEAGGKAVNVTLVQSIEGAHDYQLYGYENEAYTLEITASEVNITAVTGTGVIRAAQTLTQLAEGYEGAKALECLTMKDWPAFKLRGYMHDVGRSFLSIDELIKQVELFSRFKVNTFHWHLTENQAWRFEVKAYPQLTSIASMTRFAGKYYTQEDCKRLLAAAKKHGVIVVPEIDMPGHSEAFVRAMGFGMQTDQGKVVLKKVLDEVVEVFADAPYIHIGGDEVSTTAAYLNEMTEYVEAKGKKVEIWNPINGISQDNLNASLAQMWGTRGYLASGKANIDSRYNYTNHFDVFADLVGIYKSNIYYHAKGTPEVAGSVSGCWNDRKTATEVDIMAQNNVWANVIATAERTWIGGGKQYIDNMTNTPAELKSDGGHGGVMLPNSGDEYEEFKSWETRFLFHKANSLKDEPIPYVKQTNVRWRITDAFPNGGSETAAFAPETFGTTASTEILPEVFTHEGKNYYSGMATGAGIYLSHTWGTSIIDAYYKAPAYDHTAYAWTFVYSPEEQTVGAQIEFQNYSRSEQDAAAPAGKWDHYGSKIWINGEEIAAPKWDNTGVSISSKEVELKNENFPGREPIAVNLKKGWNKVFLKLPYFNKGYRLKKWMFTCVFTDLQGKNAVEGLIYSPSQSMDVATENVAAKVSEIKRDRGNLVGTAVGLWPENAATTLDATVAEIEATYSVSMTAEERAAQLAALEAAWAAFSATLTTENMNKPEAGKFYRMFTPLRESRYPTSKGAGNAIMGEQNPTTNASIWKFVARADGAFDIVNFADGTYISPASSNNTALNSVATQPSAGWTISPAASLGKVIITCGSVQFNQTGSGQSYKLYNWGDGTNTTDTGCQYEIYEVEAVEEEVKPAPAAFAIFSDLENQTYPFALGSAQAKVFAKENITIAVDMTAPAAAMSGRQALVCAADPTKGITGATQNNSPYIGFGFYGTNPVYLASSKEGDRFTYRDFSAAANTNYKVVYVIDKTNKQFSVYVDGSLKSTATYPVVGYELQSFSNFAANASAQLYVGGGVVSSNSAYDKFAGKIHSVHFFDGALSAAEIANIDYTQVDNNTMPEVGNYYRIAYDYGGEAGVKYLQSVNSPVKGLAMTEEKGDNSIFYVEQVGTNIRLKSCATGKYLKEDGNTRGLHDEGGNITFTECEGGKVKIQAPAYLHANNSGGNYFVDHCSSDGCAQHQFVVEPVKVYALTINALDKVGASATWNGETKTLPATWLLLDGATAADPTLTIHDAAGYTFTSLTENGVALEGETFEISTLTENRTLTANFTPAFFSSTYGEKWVRLQNCSNGAYWANVETVENGGKGKTVGLDYTDEKQLWCLVGDANSFVIYNKAAGSDLMLKVPAQTYADGSEAILANDAEATWKLKEQDFGFALLPTHSNNASELGINMYGGAGGYLKLYMTGTNNTGSYWVIEQADVENPLTFNVELEGVQHLPTNTRIAEIACACGDVTSNIIIKNGEAGKPVYLPKGAAISLSQSWLYHGYTFNGFKNGEEYAETFAAAAVPAEGITVSYSVDADNEYQYLYWYRKEATNAPYRIPAITVTKSGNVLAISDYRTCGDDIGMGEVDIMFRRSADTFANWDGKSWTDEDFVADGQGGNENVFNVGFGDAAVVSDRESGKTLVMAVAGKQRFNWASATSHNSIARIVTEDDGENWTITDVTKQFMADDAALLPNAYSMFFTSGRILQSSTYKAPGAEYYRLYSVLVVNNGGNGYPNYAVYSDDFGQTWKILGGKANGVCCASGNETKIEELPNGDLVVSVRRGGGRTFNIFSYGTGENDKANGVGSWENTAGSSFGASDCNGELLRVGNVLLQSIPKRGYQGKDRSNVAIYYKVLDPEKDYSSAEIAAGWTELKQISYIGSAYSTMTLLPDGKTLAFLYEEDPDNGTFAYCIVYLPIDLTEVMPAEVQKQAFVVNAAIDATEISTFFANDAVALPEGVKAYVATELPVVDGEETYITLTELTEGVIPAKTAVVLRGAEGKYTFAPVDADASVEGNLMKGYAGIFEFEEVALPADASVNYALAVENEVAAFYQKDAAFNVYNHKAYLNASVSAKVVNIRFENEDGTTDIIAVPSVNGKAEIYDVQGRKVANPTKGFYIVNGKKQLF